MLTVSVLGRSRPSGIEQHWRTSGWVRVIKYHPSVMVLAGIGALTHIEPSDALRQHENRSERGGRHHVSDTLSSHPLKAHQQRELALHGSGQGQRVAQKLKYRLGRSPLPSMDHCLAVGRVGYDAAASTSDAPAREEIDTRQPEPTVGDVRRDDLVTVRGENGRDRASATARLPDRSTEPDVV